jgi:transposase
MSKKRRTFSAEFKCRVALEALKEQEPINAIASRYDVLPVQVSQWKAQVLGNMSGSFESPRKKVSRETDWQRREAYLFRRIGQLEVERDCERRSREHTQPAIHSCLFLRRAL